MKKLISVALIAMMVVALSIATFADTSPPGKAKAATTLFTNDTHAAMHFVVAPTARTVTVEETPTIERAVLHYKQHNGYRKTAYVMRS